MICPKCQSSNIVKNGHIHSGKPKFSCKDCGRQFVENPENTIPRSKKDLIDKLLLERIPLAGIARVVGIFIGDQGQKGAQGLWDSLPVAMRPQRMKNLKNDIQSV